LRTARRRHLGAVAEVGPARPVVHSGIIPVHKQHCPAPGRRTRRRGESQLINPESAPHCGHLDGERVITVGELGPLTEQPIVFGVQKRFGGPEAGAVDEALPFRIPRLATAGTIHDRNLREGSRSPELDGCS